jgi:hypothetical protein
MTVSQIAKRALLAGVVVTSIIAIIAATAGALISGLAGMLGAFVGLHWAMPYSGSRH